MTDDGAPPAAEVAIDEDLAAALVADQFPDLAGLSVRPAGEGWDNALFRLGDDLAVRMPRRAVAVELMRNEARWLPALAPLVPLPVPDPVAVGGPGRGYPWPWSLVRWIPGSSALAAPVDTGRAADDLGAFVASLRVPAPPDAPTNPWRGVPLATRDDLTDAALRALPPEIEREPIEAAWADARDARRWVGPPTWVHGDLHPGNVVVDGGEVVGVIDFGDVCAGDPATDLGIAWMLFDPTDRERFRRAADADESTWRRGRGWAVAIGLALVTGARDRPEYLALGERTLAVVVADRD